MERAEWDVEAAKAAEEIDRARQRGEQLGLFGEAREADQERAAVREAGREAKRIGRPPGARNKAKLGLAEYMAARGYRAPGEHVALAAGLGEDGDPLEIAFRRAVWLQQAAVAQVTAGLEGLGEVERARVLAEMAQGLVSLTAGLWREQNQAAAQLLPYTLQRLAPAEAPKDAAERPRLGIAAPSAQLGPAVARAALLPADLRVQVEQYQGVEDEAGEASDDDGSDGGASS